MLTRFDLINLIRDVNYDDAFYYFQIAYNLAHGEFSTFDGGITRTNGYHPLWLFAVTPFYWLFDKEAALFAIKAFEIMLVAGGVALVAAAARLARLPWILLFALLPMLCVPTFYGIRALITGLEAALALFMLALLFLSVMLYARSPSRWKWLLAAVAFALPWVRLEYIAISLAATGGLCLIELSWRDKPCGASWRELTHTLSRLQALPPLLAAVAGILVYFAYNRLVFGGIIPVSAATKRALSQARWNEEGGYSLLQNFQDTLQITAFDYELLVALEVCAYLLLVWGFARRSRSLDDRLMLAFLLGVFSLAMGHLAKFAQSVLTMHPHWGDNAWYFVPAYLMVALIIPVRCYVAIHFVRRFVAPKSLRAANVLSLVIVIVGAVLLLAMTDFNAPFKYVDLKSESYLDDLKVGGYAGTLVANRALPDDSILGAWDAGVIGYFSRFPVVNLDGMVNSYDHYHATNVDRDGYADWKDGEFKPLYRALGITHFANLLNRGVSALIFEGSLTFSEQAFRERAFRERRQFNLGVYELTEDFDAAWFYEQMRPHFHYESNGVGLIVDGRLAQAFTQDCEPGEFAVWSWSGQANGSIGKAWQQAQTGLCTISAVLPHDASLPIRVEAMTTDDYLARLIGDSQPAIRSNYDVYLTENELIYAKRRQCAAADTAPIFFFHVEPIDVEALPDDRKQYGFDNLDFGFEQHDATFGDTCVVTVPLPDYDIGAIRTGQYVQTDDGFKKLWEGEINLDAAQPIQVDLARLVSNDAPAIRSDFDVYLTENRLIYTKEQCVEDDTEASFFLHITPIDVEDLPDDREQYGFDNLDFGFGRHGEIVDGDCVATVPLPDYDIGAIRTGQYVRVDGGYQHLWEGEIRLTE